MATFSGPFRVPQTHQPFQFVPYDGPPKPKQPSQRNTAKVPFGKDAAAGSTAERNDLVSESDEIELVDLTCLDEEPSNYDISGSGSGESGNVSSDDRFSPSTEWEGVKPTCQEDTVDEVSRRPAASEGSSQRDTVVIVDDNESASEAGEGDSHKDEVELHIDNQGEAPGHSALSSLGGEVATERNDIMNPENRPSQLARLNSLSTPPTSPPRIDTERSTKYGTRSTLTEATTHQPQRLEQKAHREVRLSTIGNTSSSGSDTSDDDCRGGSQTTSQNLKRPAPADSKSRKRQSRIPNTTSKPRNSHAAHFTGQQKPSPSQKTPASRPPSDDRSCPGAQSNGRDTEMRCSEDSSEDGSDDSSGGNNERSHFRKGPKPYTSRQGSAGPPRSNTQKSSSTQGPSNASRNRGPSTNGTPSGQDRWHPSHIAFHPISDDVSFFTALFRARSGHGALSTSYATTLMENVVGRTMKLDDITIRPFPPDAWFLTALVRNFSNTPGRRRGQPAPTSASSKPNGVDMASSRAASRPSDDIDDGTSSDDYSCGGDEEEEEYSSRLVDKTSNSRKRAPDWSEDDENNLYQWKKDGKSWPWICTQFPKRSPGAVKLRWYTKLRGRA